MVGVSVVMVGMGVCSVYLIYEQLMQFGQSGGGRTQAEPDTLLDTAAEELSPSVGHTPELLTQNCCLKH